MNHPREREAIKSSSTISGKRRGAFLNTAEAACSIFESGRMVFECIKDSPFYELEYFSIDTINVDLFNLHSKFCSKNVPGGLASASDYDFYVFNWHFVTMASDIDPAAIKRLQAPKFSIVLELAPGDPLMLMPKGVFDGFIALDPSIEDMEPIYAFPRPLEMAARKGRASAGRAPVIGSFGFDTPAKGFELLVEAVNREFDRAKVRINIPHGRYTYTEAIHGMPYAQRLEEICKKIAKPGIEVSFTSDFLSPEGLVDWCADNDLNCFMYTRAQPGLAATTDQCILSGQPLLTLTNDTFRHIHRYIEPYPFQGLRKAISQSGRRVQDMQKYWSRQRFLDLFHRMLDQHKIIASPGIAPISHERQNGAPIIVLSAHGQTADHLFDYAQKLANALGRSRQQEIVHLSYAEAAARLAKQTTQPAGVILVDYDIYGRMLVDAILQRLSCPKVIIPISEAMSALDYPHHWPNTVVFPRMPVIPFHTTGATLRSPLTVILLGFVRNSELLQNVVARILRECRVVEIVVEASQPEIVARAVHLSMALKPGQTVTTARFDLGDPVVANRFGESALVVAHNDEARGHDLETLVSLAMVTERAVVFTRAGPFAGFLGRGVYIEDHTIPDLVEMGLSAHIKPLYDFGEWTIATSLRRVLDGSWREAVKSPSRDAIPILSPEHALQIAAKGVGAVVAGGAAPVRAQLGRRRVGPALRALGLIRAARYFRQADKLRDARQWQDSARQYRQGLELAPERFAQWVQYGHAAKESGDLSAAEHAYGEALLLEPRDADLHLQLGHFYNLRGEGARARACYVRARELGHDERSAVAAPSPWVAGDAAAFFARGDRLRDVQDWRGAAEAYAAGLEIAPDAVAYWIQLGNMRKDAGDLAQSEDAYKRALRLSPEDQDLHVQFGHLLRKAGRHGEAASQYRTAVALGSRDRYALAEITSPADQLQLLRDVIRLATSSLDAPAGGEPAASFHREIMRAHARANLN